VFVLVVPVQRNPSYGVVPILVVRGKVVDVEEGLVHTDGCGIVKLLDLALDHGGTNIGFGLGEGWGWGWGVGWNHLQF